MARVMQMDPEQPTRQSGGWLSDAAAGRAGVTVRCTPRARTVRVVLPGGAVRFAKGRYRAGAAAREAAWLRRLAALRIRVPRLDGVFRGHGAHWIGLAEVQGQALQLQWREAVSGQPAGAALRIHVRDRLAPWVARFHGMGLVHRDLYGNHLFAASLSAEITVIDVERVFRPRWRMSRWRIKDLAALWSSRPESVVERLGLVFLVTYLRALGMGRPERRRRIIRWLPKIRSKAEHMRTRRPRFG